MHTRPELEPEFEPKLEPELEPQNRTSKPNLKNRTSKTEPQKPNLKNRTSKPNLKTEHRNILNLRKHKIFDFHKKS